MQPIYVGVDIGKRFHHACVIDATGSVLLSRQVLNSESDLNAIAAEVERQAEGAAVWVIDVVSEISALLLAILAAREVAHVVRYVPGAAVSAMSKSFVGEGKTDARDAKVIAELGRLRRSLRTVSLRDDATAALTTLTSYRSDLAAEWVANINRLRAILTSIFPGLEQQLDLSTKFPLILVSMFCTPTAVIEAGEKGVHEALLTAGVYRNSAARLAAAAMESARHQSVRGAGESDIAALTMRLASRLLLLLDERKLLDKQIAELFRQHRHAALIESIPGLGPQLGAELLVCLNGDIRNFANAGKLASYAGLVPVPRDSGRISGNMRRPRRYNRRLRRVFYLAAMTSLKDPDSRSRQYYDRKRSENRTHTQATLALARRQVDVLWAVLRDERPYTGAAPEGAVMAA
ncbi:Transposase IS116/IS110/IS902 family protein OS=Tsukamurella paurometabola (strain ATCC 8368 / DSM 20162 / CCUG 35730 / CIP 100753 / JCM 10117 / KCTC 9821 / NBRC 16120 / NCIMB 702349 / NCTC 13040) OX=521096 GN=Tpau_0274 PE=4 SV=1 [Tsukamurella paurometabola]|uniref:Transposase IS116/IS110/IS902 family protein n=1 Tax=Tsukamurella paurometabola (strain ATCC 8368 / DSM 20162 / CCUG 35730 / CIP 100753 / JCM 10117 / KCTC 9821 / NBRC 16120 / NCIMB 702349 / NCTC 13040) TaxID=521096 RepID=D5UQU0_TSUPD|nr:transposase IS116/IS110/IS902 family protein [Tsukamurella paurometabola DSM 20162]SUP27440.1 Transposase IS116/IS110/IS902 family [Tsukamurella paurometabola]ADG77501.1 transposase IS116/IS110/IS902 family protein [Tsukamurella paurometabola DSM 20162]ADG79696.1 transposase IS116/IS110/IS902 family protein [Tsukamurella paurometabola DSM 20162]SUP36819.1 Transposase IS116/IS110/IS902 family [Tsukamurella paurometabola]